MELDRLLLLLAIAYVAARLGAELAGRLKQPLVIGEILAGVVIGSSVLGWIPQDSLGLDAMAELGVIFLLFSVGLETELSGLRRVGGRAMGVATGGMLLPFLLGAGLILLIGGGVKEALFAGAALSATSVGITARVLKDKDVLHSQEARVILGAAVFDDVLTLLLLTAVTALVAGAGLGSLIGLTLYALTFVLLLTTFGRRLIFRISPRIPSFNSDEPGFGLAIALALVLAVWLPASGLQRDHEHPYDPDRATGSQLHTRQPKLHYLSCLSSDNVGAGMCFVRLARWDFSPSLFSPTRKGRNAHANS